MMKEKSVFLKTMKQPSARARIQGPCGDVMEFSLKIKNNVIRRVSCSTSGCGASKSCILETAKMARGKSLAGALLISPGKVIQKLRHVPDSHLHCAILSVNTLHRAIADYLMRGKRKIGIRRKGASQ